MSSLGIDRVEIEEQANFFYVHREAGYWNRYHISEEPGFLAWIIYYEDTIEISELS